MQSGYQVSDELKDGTPVIVRSIRASDRDAIARAFADLDAEAVYRRFFTYKKTLTDADLKALTEVAPEHGVALVLVSQASSELLGGGRFCAFEPLRTSGTAELAFMTSEGHRGRGVAGILLRHLIAIARIGGLKELHASVLAHNAGMLAVFKRSGLPMSAHLESGVVNLQLSL